jgi:broad specificity phosphatase PhoE
MSRAQESARLAGFADRIETVDDLREYDYGVYEGRTRAGFSPRSRAGRSGPTR